MPIIGQVLDEFDLESDPSKQDTCYATSLTRVSVM